MRTKFRLPARVPLWVAAFALSLFAAAGVSAILRAIPPSYAGVRNGGTPATLEAGTNGFEDAPPGAAATLVALKGQRGHCPECGVIESMRPIGDSSGGNLGVVDGKVGRNVFGGESSNAIAVNAVTRARYEFTVRFHDGAMTVFSPPSPGTWHVGSRVIVVGRSVALNN